MEETLSGVRLPLHFYLLPQQCVSTILLSRHFLPRYLFLSGEESSPGRSLQAHHVVLLSNLSWCLLWYYLPGDGVIPVV